MSRINSATHAAASGYVTPPLPRRVHCRPQHTQLATHAAPGGRLSNHPGRQVPEWGESCVCVWDAALTPKCRVHVAACD